MRARASSPSSTATSRPPDNPVSGTIAESLRDAFEADDVTRVASLLASDVRWGGEEDTDDTCHTRDQVLAWYGRIRDRGVRARVTEVIDAGDRVVLGLALHVPGANPGAPLPGRLVDPSRPMPAHLFQVFRIVDGLVVDIRGFPERAEAVAFAGGTSGS
jgi:SnoaL-like domain